ncbi:MAG: DUF1800 domain-containing protein [Gemmatimonadaceae bacterium]|nr:DUF1800 domain-containing protein [Gemmatimonadaceae bacterium]NUR19285.1 DUF1800 domain-containing protein [Gemmatimonadaceae bacterium]NUS96723.1 DUF1800 domain-containing protein [Gemmatimonadaceae bacterium]
MRSGRRIAPVMLLALAGCAHAARTAVTPTVDAIAERELSRDEQARHVLDRLAFGARPGDLDRVREMGIDRWIEGQLRPERIADPNGEKAADAFPVLREDPAALLRDVAALRDGAGPDTAARRALRMRYNEVGRAVQSARLARATTSERQLQEVLVDLWANHFSVFAGKGPVRLYLARYEDDAIRPHVLGRFRDLLGAVAHSPAMLFYLDNWQSAADSLHPTLARRRGARRAGPRAPRGLNENYARELMELHTLGVDGGYTQHDVIEVARALTGWSIASPREGGGFVFRPALHDAGEKIVLGVRIPAGGGESDGEKVLDILARHPATARMVATTLARRFVSDDPPPALIDRAAAVYRRTGGDLREVVRTIVTSPEFFSRASYRAKVKSPLELVASALRATGIAADTTPRAARAVAQLGQPTYGHQTPEGWPEHSSEWLSAGAVADRVNFIATLAKRVPMDDSTRAMLESSDFQRR